MASAPEKKFDVFIAQSIKDEQFKDTLVDYLEKNKITWCHEQQDSVPGTTESLDIKASMKECEKIIFIMSKEYLKNYLKKSEDEKRSQSGLRRNIIYVLYGDVSEDEIPESLKSLSYLRYPDPDGDKRFLLKLKMQIGCRFNWYHPFKYKTIYRIISIKIEN